MNNLSSNVLTLTIWPPYFDHVSSGTKTVEGRPFNARYANLTNGDRIQIVNKDRCDNCVVEITRLTRYPTFQAMLEKEGLVNCLPGVGSLKEGVDIYRSFPNYEFQERQYGVIAIAIKVQQTCKSTVLSHTTSNVEGDQGTKRKTPTKSYNENPHKEETDSDSSKNSRTQYIARRVITPEAHRASRILEATLKKIYVNMIKEGRKTIEGRINSGMFSNLREGQLVRFFYMGYDSGEVVCKITKLKIYNSFEEMLTEEGHEPCLPDAPSLDAAISTYHKIPGYTERARNSGVVAIHLKKISEM
jgi:ASC-1-like (ASCH) protein